MKHLTVATVLTLYSAYLCHLGLSDKINKPIIMRTDQTEHLTDPNGTIANSVTTVITERPVPNGIKKKEIVTFKYRDGLQKKKVVTTQVTTTYSGFNNNNMGGAPPANNNIGGYGGGAPPANNNIGGYGGGAPPANNNIGGYGGGAPPANNNNIGCYGGGAPPANNNMGGYGGRAPPANNNNMGGNYGGSSRRIGGELDEDGYTRLSPEGTEEHNLSGNSARDPDDPSFPLPPPSYDNHIAKLFRQKQVEDINRIRREVWAEPQDLQKLIGVAHLNELPTVCLNEALSREATKFAKMSADAGRINHNLGNTTPQQRYNGFQFSGENLADTFEVHRKRSEPEVIARVSSQHIANTLRLDLKEPSKGHYKNMVSPQGVSVGIGIWWKKVGDFERLYTVHVFSRDPACHPGGRPGVIRRE